MELTDKAPFDLLAYYATPPELDPRIPHSKYDPTTGLVGRKVFKGESLDLFFGEDDDPDAEWGVTYYPVEIIDQAGTVGFTGSFPIRWNGQTWVQKLGGLPLGFA